MRLVSTCLAASASSSQASRTGFKAIMLLWERVRDSNLEHCIINQVSLAETEAVYYSDGHNFFMGIAMLLKSFCNRLIVLSTTL